MRATTIFAADWTTFYVNFHLFARRFCGAHMHSILQIHICCQPQWPLLKSTAPQKPSTSGVEAHPPLSKTIKCNSSFRGGVFLVAKEPRVRKCLHNAQMPTRAQDLAVSWPRTQLHPHPLSRASPLTSYCIIINASCNEADDSEILGVKYDKGRQGFIG